MKDRACSVVFVGDQQCGKTSLCKAFLEGSYQQEYSATVDETYNGCVDVRKKALQLTIHDTSGQEVYDRLRPLSYNDGGVVALCFDIGNPASLENVTTKWHVETAYCCVGASLILVGCKTDLRGIDKEGAARTVKKEVGQKIADDIGAVEYVECSVFDRSSLCRVFKSVGRTALKRKRDVKRGRSWWAKVWRKVSFR